MLLESFPWLSLVPPIVAIVLCFATKEVLPSLFIGVFLGALILKDLNPVLAIADTAIIIRDNLADSWNATVVLFDFIVGGMVGLLYYSG
jgi:Na+/H+ antiporter NhaC